MSYLSTGRADESLTVVVLKSTGSSTLGSVDEVTHKGCHPAVQVVVINAVDRKLAVSKVVLDVDPYSTRPEVVYGKLSKYRVTKGST